jgi:hypothetical protein
MSGHPLEGSRQEAKLLPYIPSCIFLPRSVYGVSFPMCRFARIRVFVGCGIDRTGATHQTPIRIKAPHGHLAFRPGIRPLALHVPQKTLGTLPCPIVMVTL